MKRTIFAEQPIIDADKLCELKRLEERRIWRNAVASQSPIIEVN